VNYVLFACTRDAGERVSRSSLTTLRATLTGL
jgi:hypothetical protein